MNKTENIKLVSLLLLMVLSFYSLYLASNYKLVCDDLDQVGGKASSPNFNLKVSSGGGSSPIGSGSSADFLFCQELLLTGVSM